MKHAMLSIVPLVLAFLATGCGNKEMEQQVASLQQQNRELSNDLSTQDAYIDEIVASINRVYEEVEQARSAEKKLLSEARDFEGGAKATKAEVRKGINDRLDAVRATLRENSERLGALQKKLAQGRKQYAGLQGMLDNLKKTVEERELSIVALQQRVSGLEGEVAGKTAQVAARDSVIGTRDREIAAVYYVVGRKDDLEKKGIIRDEGGFLSIGETTVLASGLDRSLFTRADRNNDRIFHVEGRIDEILPRRDPSFYRQEQVGQGESLLTVADADRFWQDKYLVILVN